MFTLEHKHMASLFVVFLVAAGSMLGCLRTDERPKDQSSSRVSITNDEVSLEERVTRAGSQIPVDSVAPAGVSSLRFGGGLAKPRQQTATNLEVELTLVAEISPPSIDGHKLQATSVVIQGTDAFVSYNMRGEPFLGAIDVFDIKNPSRPELKSSVTFVDSDIHAVSIHSGKIYAAQGTGASEFSTPAALEVFQTKQGKLVLDGSRRVDLPSFAATSMSGQGNSVYVTTGDGGGVYKISRDDLSVESSVDLHDARWVDSTDKLIVVVQGTPGQISVFDLDLAPLASHPFSGGDIPESKATIEVFGNWAFVAGGSGGTVIFDLGVGEVVATIPPPSVSGLAPSVVVTNAVSVDEDLIFMSNGEAGVYVTVLARKIGGASSDDIQNTPGVTGRLRFEDLASVNDVAFRKESLFVAAGLGGVKIVQVETR